MPASTAAIIKAIVPLNNRYRDSGVCTRSKLESMWEIGDVLVKMGVRHPHSLGRAVQRETAGLVKRPTIFRSYKIRVIWETKDALIKDIGGLCALSNLKEMLPLVDPAQQVRERLTKEQYADICRHACSDPPEEYRRFLAGIKRQFSHGRLGRPLDKAKHLSRFTSCVKDLRTLRLTLLHIIEQEDPGPRTQFRTGTSEVELRAFSNMCLALTTKDNYRLYKGLGPAGSTSTIEEFRRLYDRFHDLLGKSHDEERARLRRVISADVLAEVSDAISSLINESAVRDFRARRRLGIRL